jgi:hypothetical protein
MVGIYEICWLQTTVLVDKPANYYNDLNGTVEIKCIDNAKVIVSKTKTFTLHDTYGRIVYCK